MRRRRLGWALLLAAIAAGLWATLSPRADRPAPPDAASGGGGGRPATLDARGGASPPVRPAGEAPSPGARDPGERVVVPGQTYRGRLLDARGAPMSGVRVSLRRLRGSGTPATDPTDAKGEFAIPLAGSGVAVELDEGGAIAQYELELTLRGVRLPWVSARPEGLSGVHEVRLEHVPRALSLLVTRSDGSPAAGARVVTRPVSASLRLLGKREPVPVSEGVVDASGGYDPEWPAWSPLLLARVTDGAAGPRHFVLEEGLVARSAPYVVVLGAKERALELEVRDERGAALPAARVSLFLFLPDLSRTHPVDLDGTTDGDGRIRWLLADTADASFETAATSARAEVDHRAHGAGWTLGRGAVPLAIGDADVSAVLTVGPSDEPWERTLWLALSPRLESRLGRPLQMHVEWSTRERESATVVGERGVHEPLLGDGGERLWPMLDLAFPDGAAVESATAWVRFESGVARRFDLPPAAWRAAADSRTPFRLSEAPDGAALRVKALDPDGAPIARAVVAAVCVDGSVRTRVVSMRRASAGDDGTALLSELPPRARWYVWVQSPDATLGGGVEVRVEDGEQDVVVRAERARALEFRVVLPDGSVPEEAICAAKPVQPETASVRQCKYDPKTGRFTLPPVVHSLYVVEAAGSSKVDLGGGRSRTQRHTGGGRMTDVAGQTIRLAPHVDPFAPSVPAPPK